MEEALLALNERCGWDCFLWSFDSWSLNVSSGCSAESATPLASFDGVSYIACPTQFSHPTFRPANTKELARVGAITPLDESDTVIAIEAETMAGLKSHVFFLVAEAVSLSLEHC